MKIELVFGPEEIQNCMSKMMEATDFLHSKIHQYTNLLDDTVSLQKHLLFTPGSSLILIITGFFVFNFLSFANNIKMSLVLTTKVILADQ